VPGAAVSPCALGEMECAKAGGHHVAFREVVGDRGGDQAIVMVNGSFFPMEPLADDPIAHRLVQGLAELGRLVMLDRRGVALSDPVSDWETSLVDQWSDDLAAVITAAGCAEPTVFSWNSVPIAQACAVRHPDLVGRFGPLQPSVRGHGRRPGLGDRTDRGGPATSNRKRTREASDRDGWTTPRSELQGVERRSGSCRSEPEPGRALGTCSDLR
jgi:pimeloyl-ACP methyl ester carboxylesterase